MMFKRNTQGTWFKDLRVYIVRVRVCIHVPLSDIRCIKYRITTRIMYGIK